MSALMANWDIAEDTMSQAMGADGSAEKELAEYQKSLQYSIDVFKAQFQELSNTTLDSSFLKGGVDAGTEFLNILTQIIDKTGILMPILSGVGIAGFIKNLDCQKVLKIA